MAKRNIIELSAQLSVGQAIEAMKALRTACEATKNELDGFYGEFTKLQSTAATRSLTLDEEKRLKQLQKQIKDTEVVYKSMMQTVSEDRRAISAIGKSLSEGLEKQTGTSLRRVIKEAEQKLMNFIGKEREMKVKVILDDGSESFMNVTSRQLVEIKQKAKAKLAGAQIGSGDTLAESESWLKATRKMTDAQRKAQEQEQEFHSTNMRNIKAEMEAKRKAAEDAALQVKANERAVQELEAKRKDRQQQGAGTSGPNKVTEQSVADAAARLADEERKTADLEAKRVELQRNLAEAQAKAAASAKEQLDVSHMQVESEEQRRQLIDKINKQISEARGITFAERLKNPVDVKAKTPEEYNKYKAEYAKRMQMREDADFLDTEKESRAAILRSKGVVKTDPLGITGAAETYEEAKHQLSLIQDAMKEVQSSASTSVIPEKYKEMKAYLDGIGGELDAIAEKAKAAGKNVKTPFFDMIKESAQAVSKNMKRMFDTGGSVSGAEKVDTMFASIKNAMSSMKSSGDISGLFDVNKLLRDGSFAKAYSVGNSSNVVRVSNAEQPNFMTMGLENLARTLTSGGMAEAEVKSKLAEAEKKIKDPQMLKEYEAYYQGIIDEIERTIETHNAKVKELHDTYGTVTEKRVVLDDDGKPVMEKDKNGEEHKKYKDVTIKLNSQGTASRMRALAKSGQGGKDDEETTRATLQQIREKLGIRGGTQKTIINADGTSQLVTEGAVPLADGAAEQKLLALLQERAVLEGKAVEAKAAGNAASSETVAQINKEIEANEQAIAQQKQAEEQARKMSEAQSNTLSANKEYAEAQERLTQSLEQAGKAEDEYKEYQRQTADSLAESEKYLRDNDATVIKNADDMRNYINTLQIQAPLLAKNAEEFARYQKAINEMKQRYAEFTENTRNNMKNLGKASDATLVQLRNHFQSIITTSGASAKEIKAAQKSIDQIDKEQHKRSMASATAPITSRATIGELQKRVQEAQQLQKSALTTRTEWKRLQTVIDQGSASLRAFNQEQAKAQAAKDMKALANPSAMSDAEIAQATKRLQDYAATSKLTADEREKLNKAIAAGNAELERKQGGDNAVRLTEQYRALTSSVDGLSKASDEALRKQSAFWLQQSAHAQAGTAQYEQAIKRYRQMADEMTRRQDVQRWELLNGQLGGADRVDVLMGRTGGATEQQIRAAIEQTTLLNKQTDITSAKYAENAQLIARGNHMLGEQKRLQEEAAKADEQARLRADAQSVEGDLTRATKQQLDILKQMYAEKLQLDERDTAARDHLIAINREEQRRLDIQKQIAAEAARQNEVRLVEQYRTLTQSANGLKNATDETLRKQAEYWLRQSTLVQEGGLQYESYTRKYREMTAEIERRQAVQKRASLGAQLGGADREAVLRGSVAGATEQQIRAAIELTTMLNRETSITSTEYAKNAELIARGNRMLGEQKRLQEEAAKEEERLRQQLDAMNAEGNLHSATKQQLDILKQMYTEQLQLNHLDWEARQHLVAINREEQNRLELQKKIAAEAAQINSFDLNKMLSNPLRYTSEQVDQALRQGEQQVRKLTGRGGADDIEEARKLAVAIDQAREAQRRFNEENQRAVMQNKLDTSLNAMSSSALAEQEKYWRAQIEGAKRGSAEAAKFADNLRLVRDEQRTAAQQQLGIKQAGGTLTDTGQGMIANIMSGTLTTIEQMKQAKQAVEEFKAKFADTRDTEGMKLLDQAIAQVTHDLAVAEKGIMSLDDVSAQLEAKAKAREDEAKKLAKGEEVKNPTQNFSQPEIERMSRSLREAYQYYEAMGDTAGIERTQRAMGMLTAETERTRQSAASLAAGEQRIAAAIANPRAEKSLKVLQAAYQQLKQKIDNANDSQTAYRENAGKLREINKAIQQVTKSMEHQKSVAERVKAALVSHWGIYLNLATIIQQVQSMIMGNVQLSDSMTNVQKVTSMTNSELTTMTRKLEELDTRTSQLDLMKLAEQAGKLGIYGRGGVQAMTEFVDVANRITSTLGEDIGGAEAVDSLVKVNDLVNKDSGMSLYESLSRIGSGILSVGNNSAASYADVVNFVNQVGAVGSVSGVSMEQLIALGGTFSSLGAAMDQSATSINKLLVGLQRNAAKVASVTGQSAAELQSLIASGDTFEALLSVVERVHEMGGNTAQTIYEILNQFGGRKNAQMFTAMALLIDNASRLREEMFYASQGYQENTLMASEYSRVQENLAGVLARIGNSIKEAFMNPDVQEAMKWIVQALGKIVEVLIKAIPIFKWPAAIFAITSAWHAATVAVKSYLLEQKGVASVSFIGRLRNTIIYMGLWLRQFNPLNNNLDETKKKMESLHTVSFGWLSVVIVGIVAAINYWRKAKKEINAENRAIGEYNATISQNIAQADAMFDALERTIDPLQKAREEHEKTVAALDQVTEANKNGKASYEEVTQAEEANRQAKERLNEASNDQARALNAVNSAYGNTIRLSQVDLNNAALLEAAHKRVAAAIRDEAEARMASKLRENVTNKHAEKIQEVEGALSGLSAKFDDDEEKKKGIGEAIVVYGRQIAHQYVKKAKEEGKSIGSYENEIRAAVGKEYARLRGWKYFGTGAIQSNLRTKDVGARAFDVASEYYNYESDLRNVEDIVASNARSNAKESANDKKSAMNAYNKAWNSIKAKASKYASNIKGTSGQEFSDAIHVLEEYVKTYKELTKKSPSSISEQDRKDFEAYSRQLEELRAAYQEKLATEIWGKNGAEPGKMSDKELVKQYNELNEWHNQLRPDMNVREALPQFNEMLENTNSDVLKNASDEDLRKLLRDRAAVLKKEFDRRGLNTSGKFKWTEGSGGKNKWKQDAKDQYNAYVKELDDFYARQKTELEQQRADGLMKENEFNARVEELDKEHYYNRAKLRNMFMEGAKRDARTGLLSDPTINRIYGDGKMTDGDIAGWKKTFEKTRSLINRLGDAFVDEVKLKSTEDRLKVAQILRKAQDELEKAIIEGDPMAKVMADYEDNLDKMHQIFGMEDWMSGNEHSDEEYRKRLEILRGYSAQINSTSESEFINQISQVKEFAGRTIEEYQLLYDSLLQLREDYDEAARKQAKKDLKLMDARVENGQYYKEQLAMYESRLQSMDWASPEAQSVMSMVEMLRKRQNVRDANGKEVSYNARQKARLEAAKKQVEREQAVSNSGVGNGMGLASAQLNEARQELAIAYDLLTARRSYMDATVAETERELAAMRERGAALQEINAKEADLAALKVMQGEAITEANEKVEESERKLAEAEAGMLSARIQNANDWNNIFIEFNKSLASAGDSQAESNAFKIAEIRARKSLGLYKETMRQRYLIIKQNGQYEEKWMTEEESLLMDNRIAAENEMKQATEKMLNDFGERMAKNITEAFQRIMELQVEQEKEQQKQQAITNEQKQGIDQRMVNEQNYTTFYKNELALRLQETREFYRQLNTLTAGSPSVVLGTQQTTGTPVGTMPGDILNHMEGTATDSDTARVGVMPGDIASQLYGGDNLMSEWTTAAEASDGYFNHVVSAEAQANEQRTKSHAKMVSAMSSAMNMYGIVYGAVMNDNLSASQKAETVALQMTGQMIISLLTASLAQVGSDAATGLAGAIAKAFSQLGPIGGAAAIAGITATIGAAMAVATSKVAKSKKQVAAATGAGAGKLTTGMLTYADGRYPGESGFSEGNTYEVPGADGKTYNARYEGNISKTGIRRGTHFGIFSEKKPEMVIDGNTTELIHKKYPQVESFILQMSKYRQAHPLPQINHKLIQRSMETISRTRAMGLAGAGSLVARTYATGNVEEVARAMSSAAASAGGTQNGTQEQVAQQAQVLAQLSSTVAQLQRTLAAGIRADISSKSFAKAKRFEKRNGITDGLAG